MDHAARAREFVERNTGSPPVSRPSAGTFAELLALSLPYVKLDLRFPVEAARDEIVYLRSRMVRKNCNRSEGWSAVCLHGMSAEKIENYTDYVGAHPNPASLHHWTDASTHTPVIRRWFEESIPYAYFTRIRLMEVAPGGYVGPHRDIPDERLVSLNIAITHPPGCRWAIRGYGDIPFQPGDCYFVDIGKEHAVFNASNEPRLHIVVHGGLTDAFRDLVLRSYLNES